MHDEAATLPAAWQEVRAHVFLSWAIWAAYSVCVEWELSALTLMAATLSGQDGYATAV
jgi:hypothetical protein